MMASYREGVRDMPSLSISDDQARHFVLGI
jgi:hypothetical protein